jgi:hypothetical protein
VRVAHDVDIRAQSFARCLHPGHGMSQGAVAGADAHLDRLEIPGIEEPLQFFDDAIDRRPATGCISRHPFVALAAQ